MTIPMLSPYKISIQPLLSANALAILNRHLIKIFASLR